MSKKESEHSLFDRPCSSAPTLAGKAAHDDEAEKFGRRKFSAYARRVLDRTMPGRSAPYGFVGDIQTNKCPAYGHLY